MRLKAPEFTRLARGIVEPPLRAAGFARSKVHPSGPEWVRRSGDGWLIVWLQNDRPGIGGRFTVEFESASIAKGGGTGPRARFFRLLTSAERESVRVTQNAIIATFPTIDPELLETIHGWWGRRRP